MVLVPVTYGIAGSLYPAGTYNRLAAGAALTALAVLMLVVYLAKPFYGFVLASSIAMTHFFSLLPTWVYKIEGGARLDDLALVVSVLAAMTLRRAASRDVAPTPVMVKLVGAVLVFGAAYTLVVANEAPWIVLREMRGYLHLLWFFVVPAFIRDRHDLISYMKCLILGSVGSAILYSAQVLLKINLGYVDASYVRLPSGGVIWRVWQGVPDLVVPALAATLWLAIGSAKHRFAYGMAGLLLATTVFLSSARALMLAVLIALLVAGILRARLYRARMGVTVLHVVFLMISVVVAVTLASRLMHVDNILTSRFGSDRWGVEAFSSDSNLLGRLELLSSVATRVSATNRLLGLGFVGANSQAAIAAGIQYFGIAQVRNNDIGVATILGQGGWLLLVAIVLMIVSMCWKFYRLARPGSSEEFALGVAIFVAFCVAALMLSVASQGIASPQVIAAFAIGAASLQVCERLPKPQSSLGR